MKRCAVPILLLTLSGLPGLTTAEVYESLPNVVDLQNTGDVFVEMLQIEEEDDLACLGEDQKLSFNLSTPAGQNWLETIVLSRSTGSMLVFDYDEHSCELLSLSMPALFLPQDAPSRVGDLDTTGPRNTIALLGTNGLTEASVTANDHYRDDVPAAVFDGFSFNEQINEDSEEKLNRGIWMVENRDADNRLRELWLEIDFGRDTKINGYGVFINSRASDFGRGPRNVDLYQAGPNDDWVLLSSDRLNQQVFNQVTLPGNVTNSRFRLVIRSNFGDDVFTEIDELEFYQ